MAVFPLRLPLPSSLRLYPLRSRYTHSIRQLKMASFVPPLPVSSDGFIPTESRNLNDAVFFFDVDNTLYSHNAGIAQLMYERILSYCNAIGMDQEKAQTLSRRYYIDYGLAVRGLVKHHAIDPVDYDTKVDGGLPLESILKPDPELRAMLRSIKIKKWVFTNAGLRHASRVLRLLNIQDCFDGITYCDYAEPNFTCKPDLAFYERVMKDAGVNKGKTLCYLVDDSGINCITSKKLNWVTIHVTPNEKDTFGHYRIDDVKHLKTVVPEVFNDVN
ncbi:Haloacid dehalogenase-like hydrolase-domain-containing protein [Paraphysoderma sedebokerense]|nr:Haloacid dehalogenase-like hydrolase-domain-containing protein [Paraphysoderma sedebokerense]